MILDQEPRRIDEHLHETARLVRVCVSAVRRQNRRWPAWRAHMLVLTAVKISIHQPPMARSAWSALTMPVEVPEGPGLEDLGAIVHVCDEAGV